MNSTQAKLSTISKQISKNQCGDLLKKEQTALSSTLTTVNTLMDEIDIEFSLGNSIGTDFFYSIRSSFDGTARAPVINQGIVIHALEQNMIDVMKR